ncbi:hypothetical protein EP331_10380 [bacterium]|nr:MAG: hypothetical protein EP331_10380 [bacterium]
MKKSILFFWLMTPFSLVAQEDVKLLNFADYVSRIGEQHPVIQQQRAILEQANAQVLSASGAFDPKLYTNYSQKKFDSKTYYQKWEAGLEYKTPSPFTFNLGVQENDGQYLNPEQATGKNQLWSLGVSMDVGRGLFTDAERTQLMVSKATQQQMYQASVNELNQFYLEASGVYWKWVESYRVWNLYNEMLKLAEIRKQALLTGFKNGDRSAADTLEAHTILRQRLVQRSEAIITYNEARLKMQAYLGSRNLDFMPDFSSPNETEKVNLDSVRVHEIIAEHPVKKQYEQKKEIIKAQLNLKKEQFRPELQLYYTYLSDTDNLQFALEDQAMLGLKFKLPLLLRKERGGLQEYQAKQKEVEASIEWVQQKLEAQLKQEFAAIDLQQSMSENAQMYAKEMLELLNFEKRLFEIGESSLFKINQREYYYALAEVDAIKAFTAYQIQLIRWKVARGAAYKEWNVIG